MWHSVEIEAFQMTEKRRWDNSEWPEWLHRAWNLDASEEGALFCGLNSTLLRIRTLEGPQLVLWGDWIIQGVQGEIYPFKTDIFAATYEEFV